MSTAISDLQEITGRLAAQLHTNQEQIAGLQGELADQQGKLSEIQHSKATTAASLEQWQSFAERAGREILVCQQDLTLAQGTSLEHSRQQALAAAQEQHVKAQSELALLRANLESDNRQGQALVEQVAALQNRIAELQGINADVTSAAERFGGEYGAKLRDEGLAAIAQCDTEVCAAQAALATLKTRREETVCQAINDLAAWPVLANELALHATVELPFMFSLIGRYLALLADIEANADSIVGEMNRLVLLRLPRLQDVPVEQIVRRRNLRTPRAGERIGDWRDQWGTPHFLEFDQPIDDWHTRLKVFADLVADALKRHREQMVADALSHGDC